MKASSSFPTSSSSHYRRQWVPCWRTVYISILVLFAISQSCENVRVFLQCGENETKDKPRDEFRFGIDFANAPEDVELVPFDWNQVKLTEKGNCGMTKCFFDAAVVNNSDADDDSNSTDAPPMGYLIANQNKYEKMRKVSQMADWMTRELGAKHLNAGPAVMVNVTSPRIRLLNDLVDQPLRVMTNMSTKDVYREDDRSVVVQRVVKAPIPSVTFGRRTTKMGSLSRVLPSFCVRVPDRRALVTRLAGERDILWRALLRVPALWRDLQGMVDVHGNFFYIDLDGAVSKRTVSETARVERVIDCMDMFDSFVRQLLECIDANGKHGG